MRILRSIGNGFERRETRALVWSVACAGALWAAPALAEQHRIGLGIHGFPDGLSVSYDQAPVFSPGWSFGGEFFGGFGTISGSLRALVWEKPGSMSGFHGGPKLWIHLGNRTGFGIGGEGGWLYRFDNRIDLGGGIEVAIGYRVGASIKLTVGYLL